MYIIFNIFLFSISMTVPSSKPKTTAIKLHHLTVPANFNIQVLTSLTVLTTNLGIIYNHDLIIIIIASIPILY